MRTSGLIQKLKILAVTFIFFFLLHTQEVSLWEVSVQALPIHPTSSGNGVHTEEGGRHWKLEDVCTGTVFWTGRGGDRVLCGRRWKETACRVSSCQCPRPVTCGHSLTEERCDTWVLSLETKRKRWSGLDGAKGVPRVSLCKTQWTKYLNVWKETFSFCPWRRCRVMCLRGLTVTGLASSGFFLLLLLWSWGRDHVCVASQNAQDRGDSGFASAWSHTTLCKVLLPFLRASGRLLVWAWPCTGLCSLAGVLAMANSGGGYREPFVSAVVQLIDLYDRLKLVVNV